MFTSKITYIHEFRKEKRSLRKGLKEVMTDEDHIRKSKSRVNELETTF